MNEKEVQRGGIEKILVADFFSYLVKGNQKKLMREVIFSINLDDGPKTFDEGLPYIDASLWKEIINENMDFIMGNGT